MSDLKAASIAIIAVFGTIWVAWVSILGFVLACCYREYGDKRAFWKVVREAFTSRAIEFGMEIGAICCLAFTGWIIAKAFGAIP